MNSIRRILVLSPLALTSCSVFDRFLEVTSTTLSIPIARQELAEYLTREENQEIQPYLMMLDRTYQPIADVIYLNSELSLEEALSRALSSAVQKQELENAYLNIRSVVRTHRARTDEAVPPNLLRVSQELESLWESWDGVLNRNQKAAMYLEIIAKLVIPLV